MKIATLLCVGAAAAGLVGAAPGAAQSLVAGQGVADRARPGYDPVGSRLGSFTLYPSVTTTAEATDNYLATKDDRRSDVYLVVQPEAYLTGDFGRSRMNARAFASQSVHANLTRENAAQYGASANVAFDPTRDMQLRADVSAASYVESRSSLGAFQQSRSPVRFDVLHAGAGVSQRFTDLTLGASGAIERRNFHDTRLRDGGLRIDQDFRDVRATSLSGSAQYDLRNGIGLIVSGSYDDEHYSVRSDSPVFLDDTFLNRDSHGYNVQGGVTLELTRLIFGTIQVGYLTRDYEDPRLNDFSGLSYNADVLWNVTPLTSVRFRASRSVQDTSSFLIAGNTRSDFRVSVDHELYRYVIVSGEAAYGRFRPNGIGIGGDEYYVGARARYLLDRRYTLSGGIRHARRTSGSDFLRYNATTADLTLRVAF